MKHQFIEDNLVILSKQTIDSFLQYDFPDDLISLYVFYYYTAKWQKTNCIKATRGFVKKALKWGNDRFIRAHKKLISLGLIEPYARKDKSRKIKGHYIKVKYLWKHENLVFEPEKPEVPKPNSGKAGKKTRSLKNHCVDFPTSGKEDTNALNANNRNALIDNKKMVTSEALRLSEYLLSKILFRKNDFKKPNLTKWAVHIDRMIRLDNRKPETIQKVIDWAQSDDFWQNNILSTDKLRKQFDKLELGMQKNDNRQTTKTSHEKQKDFSQQRSKIGVSLEV